MPRTRIALALCTLLLATCAEEEPTQKNTCACDTSGACETGCSCDPNCLGSCTCNTTAACDTGCTCDTDCTTACACNTASGSCQAGCTCDPDCAATGAWSCPASYRGTDDGCDCGCGEIDPDCSPGGCAAPGCDDAACEYCYDASGQPVGCPCACDVTVDACDVGCDCDEDCDLSCPCNVTTGACDAGCICDVECATGGWTCRASYYGDDDCDCGCGSIDSDCPSTGCATPGCFAEACEFCYDAEGSMTGCPCDCDVTAGTCDAGCECDPDCGG